MQNCFAKRIMFFSAFVLMALQTFAQKIQLTIQFPSDSETAGLTIYANPLDGTYDNAVQMQAEGNKYSAEVTISESGFYNLIGIKNNTQVTLPVYITEKTGSVNLNAQIKDENFISIINNADNKFLSAINVTMAKRDRDIWSKQIELKDLASSLSDYRTPIKESAASSDNVSAIVKKYADIWAYISTYNIISTLPRIYKIDPDSVPLTCESALPSPSSELDDPLASLFPMAITIMTRTVPKGTLVERIEYVRTSYQTETLRKKVEESVLDSYLTRYDYNNKYEEGLDEITSATEKFGLDTKYMEGFKKRKSAIKGASFPENIELKDKDGNIVKFSDFKGKYVYLDLWASWCVPCCKEVPLLQKMEEELQNEDVVFVSISIDSKESAWKAKMQELNMHGNQLFNSDAKLCDALNVTGIPFFLVYDKEGKLHTYGAPRPSQGESVKTFLENLK